MTWEVLFPQEFVNALLVLLATIVLDLILGVSVALKNKTFDLKKLADFYRSSVIPNLIGWGGADIVLRLVSFVTGTQLTSILTQVGTAALYGIAMAALLGSIAEKVTCLKGNVVVSESRFGRMDVPEKID